MAFIVRTHLSKNTYSFHVIAIIMLQCDGEAAGYVEVQVQELESGNTFPIWSWSLSDTLYWTNASAPISVRLDNDICLFLRF